MIDDDDVIGSDPTNSSMMQGKYNKYKIGNRWPQKRGTQFDIVVCCLYSFRVGNVNNKFVSAKNDAKYHAVA